MYIIIILYVYLSQARLAPVLPTATQAPALPSGQLARRPHATHMPSGQHPALPLTRHSSSCYPKWPQLLYCQLPLPAPATCTMNCELQGIRPNLFATLACLGCPSIEITRCPPRSPVDDDTPTALLFMCCCSLLHCCPLTLLPWHAAARALLPMHCCSIAAHALLPCTAAPLLLRSAAPFAFHD